MSRPVKKRYVMKEPEFKHFRTVGRKGAMKTVLTIDEYETLRLIDVEGLTQEECAEKMKVGRTTIQSIYSHARYVLSDAMVNGKELIIDGGQFVYYDDAQ